VPLQRVRGPVVQDVVQELATVPADVFAFRGGCVVRDYGDKSGTVDVLDDELQRDDAGRRHDLHKTKRQLRHTSKTAPSPSPNSGSD
jgi:hypothetical protein